MNVNGNRDQKEANRLQRNKRIGIECLALETMKFVCLSNKLRSVTKIEPVASSPRSEGVLNEPVRYEPVRSAHLPINQLPVGGRTVTEASSDKTEERSYLGNVRNVSNSPSVAKQTHPYE